jgi:hypothetical protein
MSNSVPSNERPLTDNFLVSVLDVRCRCRTFVLALQIGLPWRRGSRGLNQRGHGAAREQNAPPVKSWRERAYSRSVPSARRKGRELIGDHLTALSLRSTQSNCPQCHTARRASCLARDILPRGSRSVPFGAIRERATPNRSGLLHLSLPDKHFRQTISTVFSAACMPALDEDLLDATMCGARCGGPAGLVQ